MPKLEAKVVQKELEQGVLWPVYYFYGQERMKSRELLKRIRAVVLSDHEHSDSLRSWEALAETVLDGSETDGEGILEATQSQSLLGSLREGPRLIVVKDAHLVKNPEVLSEILLPKAKRSELNSVCVLIGKDLDGRKKFSKILQEKAAIVPCEEISESDREAWIFYLAKRKEVQIPSSEVARLTTLDPWSLDIVDQELEKYSLFHTNIESLDSISDPRPENPSIGRVRSDEWIDAFLSRDLKKSLQSLALFAEQPHESLPLLGLLAWNVRYLAMALSDSGHGLRGLKVNPYVVEKLQRWSKSWELSEVLDLQAELTMVDFNLKQTPLAPIGIWSVLVMRFCKS